MHDLKENISSLKQELEALHSSHAPCAPIIAGLKIDLDSARAAHTPCDGQIRELKVCVARLDKDLAMERERAETLAQELSAERCNVEKLQCNLNKSIAAHAGCDAHIQDLKDTITSLKQEQQVLHKAHSPCHDIIARLQSELAAVKAAHAPCDAHSQDLKGTIASLKQELEAVRKAHAPCAAQIKELSADVACLDKKFAVEQERAEALAKELSEQKRSAAEIEATLRQNIVEMVANLSKEKQTSADLQDTLDCLTAEHDKCQGLLTALRRQIKETKDALEHDDAKLQDTKAKAEAQTMELERQLQTRVKLASAPQPATKGRRVKLGASAPPPNGGKQSQLPLPAGAGGKLSNTGLTFASMDMNGDGVLSKEEFKSKLRGMGWSIKDAEQCFAAMDRNKDGDISADEFAAFCQMEDKRLEVGTLSGIAKLQQEIAALKKAHQPCASTLADRDAEVAKLQSELAAVKAAHAPCDDQIKELEGTIIAQKQELEALRKAHAPCPDMIAGLERDLDAAKAAHAWYKEIMYTQWSNALRARDQLWLHMPMKHQWVSMYRTFRRLDSSTM